MPQTITAVQLLIICSFSLRFNVTKCEPTTPIESRQKATFNLKCPKKYSHDFLSIFNVEQFI